MEENNENKNVTEEMVEEEVKETKDNSLKAVDVLCIASGIIGLCAGYFVGSKIAGKRTSKKLHKEFDREMEEETKKLIRTICPETNVKYIVERFNDYNGKTYGKFRSNRKLIEKVADETAKRIKNELVKEN